MAINSGIYVIYFECDDGQYYIGKSCNIHKRYTEHCNALRKNIHHNIYMQQAYHTYGMFPSVEALEEVININDQSAKEKYWIKIFDSYNNGMNDTIGGDGVGYGYTHPSSLYTKEVYYSIFDLLVHTNKSNKDIAKELGVSLPVVQSISNGTSHNWLEIEYPDMYLILKNKQIGKVIGVQGSYDKNLYILVLFLGSDPKNSINSIVNSTGLTKNIVTNILYGYSHVYLSKEYPKEYEAMYQAKGTRYRYKKQRKVYPNIVSPDGQVFTVNNCRQFANSMGLGPGLLGDLLNKRRDRYKGWTLA